MILKSKLELFKRIADWIDTEFLFARTVSVAVSGGVDSALVAAAACEAKGPENVVGLFRGIHSAPQHLKDARELAQVLGFSLYDLDFTSEYESIKKKFKCKSGELGKQWHDENSQYVKSSGFQIAYASFKSRFTTPLMGFMSKFVCGGGGAILGTGNFEEDVFLRYFDKFGDGAIDKSPIMGLLKVEVRQLVLFLKSLYGGAGIFEHIARKIPSADLWGVGDEHNDESELSSWAKAKGYKEARLTYGDLESEGTIAWATRQEDARGVIKGKNSNLTIHSLMQDFGYKRWQAETICFIREIEEESRHKDLGIPGLDRKTLIKEGFVG